MSKHFYSGILAGVFIAIAASVNLSIGGIFGAIFFAVGLLAILYFKLDLYTGKAGLVGEGKLTLGPLGMILLGNFIGALAAGTALGILNTQAAGAAYRLWGERLLIDPISIFIRAAVCGMLMYFAVTAYNTEKKIGFVIIPVAAFILGGFIHSIADMAYFGMAASAEASRLKFIDIWPILPAIIGNFGGCIIIPVCKDLNKELKGC